MASLGHNELKCHGIIKSQNLKENMPKISVITVPADSLASSGKVMKKSSHIYMGPALKGLAL